MAEEPKVAETTNEAEVASKEQPSKEEKDAAKDAAKEAKKKKQEEKKAKKAAEKAAKEAAKKAKKEEEERKKNTFIRDPNDPCVDLFGDRPLNRSQDDPNIRFQKKYVAVKDLDQTLVGQEVRVRCRVHNSRGGGSNCFIEGRESYATVQFVMFVNLEETAEKYKISKGMVKYAQKIPKESIVEIVAKVIQPEGPITSCS